VQRNHGGVLDQWPRVANLEGQRRRRGPRHMAALGRPCAEPSLVAGTIGRRRRERDLGCPAMELATVTNTAWLVYVAIVRLATPAPFMTNDGVCARPGTTMSSAVARNRMVLLKYV